MSKAKDISTRSFKVHEGKKTMWPETIVIQHDVGPLIRKSFGLAAAKKDKPAEVIPFESKK